MITRNLFTGILCFIFLLQICVQAQPLRVEQVKDNTYTLTLTNATAKSQVFWSAKADSWQQAKLLPVKGNTYTADVPEARPVFKLQQAKRKPYYAAAREVKLEGANNFRDLGGYITKDERQVKWGKIYRSADISKLTDDDLKIVNQLNISMVCDLRGEAEAERAPDKVIAGSTTILLAAGSENVGGSWMRYLTSPERADSMMRAFYTRTDHLKAKYKPMFDQLLSLDADKALMFHCTAGKDRTGVGAALILYSLGVDEKVIYEDYEATNEFRKNYNEEYVKAMAEQGVSADAAKNLMAAKAEYLKAFFDSIRSTYGSPENFLTHQLELTPEKIKVLKAKYLY